MIKGVGVDIIEIDRVQKILDRYGQQFLEKIYTKKEIEYCSSKAKAAQHYAARFAAKEAISKAIGTGFNKDLMLRDIEVDRDKNGKPHVKIKNQRNENILISISHSDHYVVAFAMIKEA